MIVSLMQQLFGVNMMSRDNAKTTKLSLFLEISQDTIIFLFFLIPLIITLKSSTKFYFLDYFYFFFRVFYVWWIDRVSNASICISSQKRFHIKIAFIAS